MMRTQSIVLVLVAYFGACTSNQPARVASPEPAYTLSSPAVLESPAPEVISSPTTDPKPSSKVAAFYYPWYGNPTVDGEWIHWTQNNHLPPQDISSDYYPALGAYSSNDPAVVEQHMKWLRQANIGVIVSSWWGQGSREDQAVPLLLQMAEQYNIQVAFHIEPYKGRTAESLPGDIDYLYKQYGSSPAFFRSAATSRYSPDSAPKGMFFLWSVGVKGSEGERVEANYWRSALDAIHALVGGALMIANTTDVSWIKGSHFDGLYNYATLHLEEPNGFDWARSLPPDSLYVPSVIPGFSAKRVGYSDTTYVPRENGGTYDAQWTSALGTGVEPAMVTLTSFNEWHEGTVIEPPQFGTNDGAGYTYADFGTASPEGYLNLTRDWVRRYLVMTWPTAYRVRIKVVTTSDWTTLEILEDVAGTGPVWTRPELISASDSATKAGIEAGDRFLLSQSLADANTGREVEMTWDVMLTNLSTEHDLILQIDRGNLGKTQVTVYNYLGETPVEVKRFMWDQVTTGRNSFRITIPCDMLIDPNF